jgi:hypothetical protein
MNAKYKIIKLKLTPNLSTLIPAMKCGAILADGRIILKKMKEKR